MYKTNKIKEISLSAIIMKERSINMPSFITDHQIKDIYSASVYSVACDESVDANDGDQIALL